jgi:hypothetical protein
VAWGHAREEFAVGQLSFCLAGAQSQYARQCCR